MLKSPTHEADHDAPEGRATAGKPPDGRGWRSAPALAGSAVGKVGQTFVESPPGLGGSTGPPAAFGEVKEALLRLRSTRRLHAARRPSLALGVTAAMLPAAPYDGSRRSPLPESNAGDARGGRLWSTFSSRGSPSDGRKVKTVAVAAYSPPLDGDGQDGGQRGHAPQGEAPQDWRLGRGRRRARSVISQWSRERPGRSVWRRANQRGRTGLLLVTAILVMPWTVVAQQPPPAAAGGKPQHARARQEDAKPDRRSDQPAAPEQSVFGYGAKDAPKPAAPSMCSTSSPWCRCLHAGSSRRDGMGELARSRASIRTGLGRRVGFAALLVAWVSFAATARAQEPSPAAAGGAAEQSDVAEIGQKLSNPVSDVWALFTEFDLDFFGRKRERGRCGAGRRDGVPAGTPVSALRQRRQRVEAHHEAHLSGPSSAPRFPRGSTTSTTRVVWGTPCCQYSYRLHRETGSSARE